uniref:Uncharacterized protein n=1 Tax=Rhizophora mucronata TaxID=61149 RepID=A0A2P2NYM7_RHIMU
MLMWKFIIPITRANTVGISQLLIFHEIFD